MNKSASEYNIPGEVVEIVANLMSAGYEAFLVGGCVRDVIMGREPKDWDIASNASPEEIQKIFPGSIYENTFGTVAVKTESPDPRLKIIEITTYRIEGNYTDKRHPDGVVFAQTVEEDLSRRDFTINAMALHPVSSEIIDPFGGQNDIRKKIIRTVGDPYDRFNEDALRLMRAVRFMAELDFKIEKSTMSAISKEAGLIEYIAKERIRDEFVKIIMTENAKEAVELLEETGLLHYIIPEMREGIGMAQNKHHKYTVWEHNILALEYAVKKGYSLEVRLASFLHDVGKSRTKAGEGENATFYNHEVVGAKMAARIMDRLHFPKDVTEKVVHLVRYHLFYYNVGEVTEAGVRRFLRRVGPEYIDDLIKVREADRIGSGVPKAVPYKLRHLLFMIEKVKQDPISPKMLKVNGQDVMDKLKIEPGPVVGMILGILLEEVLDNPSLNNKTHLEKRIAELGKIPEKELEKISGSAKDKKEEFESGLEEEMKKKFHVK